MRMHLAKLLVREDLVTVEQIREALERQRELDYGLGESLADLGYVTEPQLVEFLGIQYGVPVMNVDDYDIEQDAVDLIPKETARGKCLIPISVTGSDLTIAISDPSDLLLLDDLGFLTGKNIKPVVASERSIKDKIAEFYGTEGSENEAADENSSQSASLNKEKYDRSIDEIITELEQYSNNQSSPSDLPQEERSRELKLDTDINDMEDDVSHPDNPVRDSDRIASGENEFDLSVLENDENDSDPFLPEAGEGLISNKDDTEPSGQAADEFDIGHISGESENSEESDIFGRISHNGEGDPEGSVIFETHVDGEPEVVDPDLFQQNESEEDSEQVIGFTSAFIPEEAPTPEDDEKSEGVPGIQAGEEHEVNNDESVSAVDDAIRLEDVGETLDISSEHEEFEYDIFTSTPEDERAVGQGADFPAPESVEESQALLSEEEEESEPLDSQEYGFGEIEEPPRDSELQKEQETFSSHPVFNSSLFKEAVDETVHPEAGETEEDAPANPQEEQLCEVGQEDPVSPVVGVNEAEAYNEHDGSSADLQGFSAPEVNLSPEVEELPPERPPPPDAEDPAETAGILTEEEKEQPEQESLTLVDTGAEQREEPDETEDLPLSREESSNGSFFAVTEEEHTAGDSAHSPQAESPVDQTYSDPVEGDSGESPVLESTELNKRQTNGAGEKGSVLVVDGSPTVQKIVSITLERQGYRVYTAGDGMKALGRLNEVTPDLIFMDVKLPHMDGYQLCKIIKSHGLTKDIPVVMMTGKAGILDKMKWKRAGAQDYITKPFDPKVIVEAAAKYGN